MCLFLAVLACEAAGESLGMDMEGDINVDHQPGLAPRVLYVCMCVSVYVPIYKNSNPKSI